MPAFIIIRKTGFFSSLKWFFDADSVNVPEKAQGEPWKRSMQKEKTEVLYNKYYFIQED